MAALPAVSILPTPEPDPPSLDLAAFVGPITPARAELYIAELDIRIAKLWAEEQATPQLAWARHRLETERLELETLRHDLWFTVLHPEAVPVPEEWPADLPEPIALDPEPVGCPACGSRREPVPLGEVCGSCKARYPERVAHRAPPIGPRGISPTGAGSAAARD